MKVMSTVTLVALLLGTIAAHSPAAGSTAGGIAVFAALYAVATLLQRLMTGSRLFDESELRRGLPSLSEDSEPFFQGGRVLRSAKTTLDPVLVAVADSGRRWLVRLACVALLILFAVLAARWGGVGFSLRTALHLLSAVALVLAVVPGHFLAALALNAAVVLGGLADASVVALALYVLGVFAVLTCFRLSQLELLQPASEFYRKRVPFLSRGLVSLLLQGAVIAVLLNFLIPEYPVKTPARAPRDGKLFEALARWDEKLASAAGTSGSARSGALRENVSGAAQATSMGPSRSAGANAPDYQQLAAAVRNLPGAPDANNAGSDRYTELARKITESPRDQAEARRMVDEVTAELSRAQAGPERDAAIRELERVSAELRAREQTAASAAADGANAQAPASANAQAAASASLGDAASARPPQGSPESATAVRPAVPEPRLPEAKLRAYFKAVRTVILFALLMLVASFCARLFKRVPPKPARKPKMSRTQRRNLTTAIEQLNGERLPIRDDIVRRYQLFLRMMEMAGWPREFWLPPTDYGRQLSQRFPSLQQELHGVTDTFCDVLYGDCAVDENRYGAFRSQFATLQRQFLS